MPPEYLVTGLLRRRWRGYHPGQVDELLVNVRTDYAAAIDRIATIAEEREQYRAGQERLQRRLAELADSARDAADQARRQADAEADAIRGRAERVAAAIINQAEQTAEAGTRHAQALRATAEQEAETAQRLLAEASRRAQQLEDAARARWDALREQTEKRFEHLQLAERRFAERILHVEEVLAVLRTDILPGGLAVANGNELSHDPAASRSAENGVPVRGPAHDQPRARR
jgi:cell division septum initiation protein DivIVA